MARSRFRNLVPSLLFAVALLGCGTSNRTGTGIDPGGNSRVAGSVHGGQQPVSGASIQIYTVGATGDGSAATPLLTAPVTTDSSGSFTIDSISCTNATDIYIVATGGNPGTSAVNPNIAMMAALGPCSSLTPGSFLNINELTTVAAVSALAPYMSSPSAVGSSPSDVASLSAAFTLAAELVNVSTGTSPGTGVPSGYTVPTTQLNTLADILAACVNSTGGTAGDGSSCGTLFTLTTVSPNPAPTNTISALVNLAGNPTQNTVSLYGLVSADAPFQPTVTTTPPDFDIRLTPSSPTSYILQISPSTLTFPSTAVNFSSPPQTVTIQNTGSSSVTFSSITTTGVNASDFAVNSACTVSLDPGSSCTVQVTATPSANGARSAYLAINSSSPDSPQYVALSVTGAAPSAGPVALSVPGLSYTLAGVLQDVTLSNLGSTTLTISSITETDISGEGHPHNFVISNSTCGTSLPAQSVCTISIASTFASGDQLGTPLTASGTVTITDDASTGPQTISLSSMNVGSIAITAPGYSFSGVGSFPAQQLGTPQTIPAVYGGYNAYGEYPWPPISPALSGLDPGDFTETMTQNGSVVNNCTPAHQGQANCDITFTFTPSAVGARTAKVSFPSGYVLLTGTGVGPGPSFRVDQSSLSLSSALPSSPDPNSIGSSTLTLTNNGTTTINVGASFTGANPSYMSANTSGCASVAPQASCTVTVNFSAPAVGSYSANLVLKDNNSSFTYTPIPIAASTSYWSPGVFPRTLTFSNQAVNTTSASQTFVIGDENQYPIGHPLSVALQPSSNYVLTQGSTCPASSTQTCTLAVAFAPQTVGSNVETVTITDQTTGLQAALYLSGTGTGTPSYTLSTDSITFPLRNINTTSVPMTVTLTSNGTQALTVSGISISGVVNNNFTQTNNCSSVPINGTCSINITFAPTATGLQSATVQITSNAANSESTISLSGSAQ